MKLFIYNPDFEAETLKDLIIGHLLFCGNVEIYANSLNAAYFNDWGKATNHSVYKNIPAWKKERVTWISPKLAHNYDFDMVLFSDVDWLSKNMNAPFVEKIFKKYNKKNIVVVDSTMSHSAHLDVARKSTYYKRELGGQKHKLVHPIHHTFPVYRQRFTREVKTSLLAPYDSRFLPNSNVFNVEHYYYVQFLKAMFATVTYNDHKGWDTMHVYEIIASHCVPYFPDIKKKPKYIMHDYPVDLQLKANKLFESLIIGDKQISITQEYHDIRDEFEEWFQECGTSYIYHKMFQPT